MSLRENNVNFSVLQYFGNLCISIPISVRFDDTPPIKIDLPVILLMLLK